MPKRQIDYNNTIMYKLVCNDINIKDLYVGHTTNWAKRKTNHKGCSNNLFGRDSNTTLYNTIRSYGGWENWSMIMIEKYPCDNKLEARKRERQLMEIENSNLNSLSSYLSIDERRSNSLDKYYKCKQSIAKKKATKIECSICKSIVSKSSLSFHKKSKKCLSHK